MVSSASRSHGPIRRDLIQHPGGVPAVLPAVVGHDLRRALWEMDRRQFSVPQVEEFVLEVVVSLLVVTGGLLRWIMSS